MSSYNSDIGALQYSTNASGSWVTTTVDSAGDVGWYTSIALDDAGKVHISYYDDTNQGLKYATNASGSWVTTTVERVGEWGGYTSIALNRTGRAHISYYDDTNKDLKYATNASGSWVTTTVDSAGDVGSYTSIALDRAGKVHISYRDHMNDDLKYASNVKGPWTTTTVDSTGDVGYYTSIALDGAGKVHISYLDYTNDDLKYATNASGSWVTTTVDSAGNVGRNTSIALDGAGRAHISYRDSTNYALKYATNASGSWDVETACDRFLGCGYWSSIAVELDGILYISHHGDDGTLLLTFSVFCPDNDSDGYGDPASTACPHPQRDCDDSNPAVNPGQAEVPGNGLDDDCDGTVDESCFIATAAFGSGLEPRVEILRIFRDRYLETNPLGRAFVQKYYEYGRPAADYIAKRPWLKGLVRILLLPVIGLVSLIIS